MSVIEDKYIEKGNLNKALEFYFDTMFDPNVKDNEFVTEENTQQWDELIAGIVTEKGGNAVSPLVTTRWDQDPYYNNLCPYSYIYGQRTVTGCVATAMAQVVNFYQHWNR